MTFPGEYWCLQLGAATKYFWRGMPVPEAEFLEATGGEKTCQRL
jgi:hypothetical protein